VADKSGQEPLIISQRAPVDFTIVEHFGHFVCIFQ
jgi:hypothetical protein